MPQMNMQHTNVFLALDALLIRYVNLFKNDTPQLPSVPFDSAWRSPCEDSHNDTLNFWRPKERSEPELFSELESALEIKFHPDIKDFYGSFWSNGICVERDDINFSLIQVWNEEDQANLKENLLGHAFAKIKARLPLSFFIGCTYGDDVVCLEQESGQIVLEKPGRKAHKVLSDSLENFLISLEPTKDAYDS